MFRKHFQASSKRPYTHNPVAQRSEDNSMISITTNKFVCNADLNLDGQEFEASGSEQQRDPAHDAAVSTSTRGGPHNDVELGSAQRHSAHQHVANAAAIHGEGWFPRARRTSRARRTPRTLLAHACASERWGPPWRARHALGAWHERGDPDESRRSNAPTPWGPPPLVAPSRLSHESMIHSNAWTLRGFVLDHTVIVFWYKMVTRDSKTPNHRNQHSIREALF